MMKTNLSIALLALLAFPAIAFAQSDPLSPAYLPSIDTNAADYPSNIWITDTMQKVRQDSGSPGTLHWGILHGTQNEFVDFQVHVQAPSGGIPNLVVTAGDFVQTAPSSYKISASSTNIVVYREAYLNVNIKTGTSPTFYNSTGHYPDILIPAVDPYWKQTTNAFPYTVAAGNNQSVWVDVLIPPSAPSGYYLGSVTVKSGSSTLATMPVIIGVWQWPGHGYMPSTTTLKTDGGGLGYNSLCTAMYVGGGTTAATTQCGSYPGANGGEDGGVTQTWLDGELLLKDHRFANTGYQNIFPGSGSFSSYVTEVGPIMNGTCNLHNGAGTTCPLLANSKTTAEALAAAGGTYNNSQALFNNWQANFNTNGWGSTLFNYLTDEPHSISDFATFVVNANTYHNWNTPAIPELVTTDIFFGQGNQSAANTFSTTACGSNTCILNAIDWMVTDLAVLEYINTPLQPKSAYTAWLAGSTAGVAREWWGYLACSEAGTCSNGTVGYNTATWPNFDIDGLPTANRASEWLTFLHGQTGQLYYAADLCLGTQGYPGNTCGAYGSNSSPLDSWVSVYYSGGWGDGTLVYPGCIVPGQNCYMGPGVTTPIILPSVRLKLIRDGMQDYEYLNILTNQGQGTLVQNEISSWITNSYTFETTGTGLQTARATLGNALHQLSYAVFLQPPTNLQVNVH